MPELTEAELEELSQRLRAGDAQAIKPAVQALKAAQSSVPSPRPAPVLTPEEKRLATLRRDYGRLRELHARYMESRRALSAARQAGVRVYDRELGKHELFIANNEGPLHAHLEAFLFQLRFHFNDSTNDHPN